MHEHCAHVMEAADVAEALDCVVCRQEAVAAGVGDVDLDRVWTGVTSRIWARTPGRIERLAGRLLRSPGLARALVTTPSLVTSWILATAVVLGVGVVVSRGLGTPLVPLLAPALAGAGIAYAYGPGTDPGYELTRTMPTSDRMVMLVRALAVFLVNAVLGVAASVLASAAGRITVGWLLPMTAVAALCLAAATLAGSANVGITVGLAGWAVAVLAAQAATGRAETAASSPALAVPELLFAALCVGLVLHTTRVPRSQKRGWL
jgi:hypothetical protein